jgi:hypothetical protein
MTSCPYDGKKCNENDICDVYTNKCDRYPQKYEMDTIPPGALIDSIDSSDDDEDEEW